MIPNCKRVERGQAKNATCLLRPSGTCSDPFLRLFPGLIERKEARLATTLDQLVRLRNEPSCEYPAGELGVGGDAVRFRVPRDLRDFWRGEDEASAKSGRGIYGRGALEPICQ